MTTCTTPTSLCNTLERLAQRTWIDLGDAHRLRTSLAEPSITDYFLLELQRNHQAEVTSKKFTQWEEGRTTGADWEWWIIGIDGTAFGVRVQAKILDIVTQKYNKLGHVAGKSGKKQIDLLMDDAASANLYPLYCFYNHVPAPSRRTVFNCRLRSSWDRFGCSIADAQYVKDCLDAGTVDFDTVGGGSLPLSCFFCCPGRTFDVGNTVLSHVAREAAIHLQQRLLSGDRENASSVPKLITSDNLPNYVQKAMDTDFHEVEPPKDRAIDGLLIIKQVSENPIFHG